MKTYNLRVRFLCGLFEIELLERVLPKAVYKYNRMDKKKKKWIEVEIGGLGRYFNIIIHSESEINSKRLLNSIHPFCIILADMPGMEAYLTQNRRLLTAC